MESFGVLKKTDLSDHAPAGVKSGGEWLLTAMMDFLPQADAVLPPPWDSLPFGNDERGAGG